jgi:hypothetical protein
MILSYRAADAPRWNNRSKFAVWTMAKSSRSPWKRSNPRKTQGRASKHLSPMQKAAASARARRAGQRYPNLVDNKRIAAEMRAQRQARKTVRGRRTRCVSSVGERRYSTDTRIMPACIMPSARAALTDKSITLPRTKGPRSLTRHWIERPSWRTVTMLPNGLVRWAHVIP